MELAVFGPQNLGALFGQQYGGDELIPSYIMDQPNVPINLPGGKRIAIGMDLPSQDMTEAISTVSDTLAATRLGKNILPASPEAAADIRQPSMQYAGRFFGGPAAAVSMGMTGIDPLSGQPAPTSPRRFIFSPNKMAVPTGQLDSKGKAITEQQRALPAAGLAALTGLVPGGRFLPTISNAALAAQGDKYSQDAATRQAASQVGGLRAIPLGPEAARTATLQSTETMNKLIKNMKQQGREVPKIPRKKKSTSTVIPRKKKQR